MTGAPAHDCRAGGGQDTLDPLPGPCAWNVAAGTITCGGGQTPCWKLQADLTDGANDADVGIGAAYNFLESTANGGFEEWGPLKNVNLPNVTPGRFFGANGPSTLCGDTAGTNNCSSCLTAGDNAQYAARSGSSSHLHFENGMNNEYMPSPSVWISSGTAKIHMGGGLGSGSGPWRATIISNGYLDPGSGGEWCCATCDCTTADSIVRGQCGKNNLFGLLDTDVQTLTLDANTDQVFDGAGRYAMKFLGDIDLPSSATIVGDIRGGSVDVPGGDCIVGNVVGYATPSSSPCNTGGTCNNAHVCTGSNVNINGDIHSMTDFNGASNSFIYGNIVTKNNICLASNASIDGAVMGAGTVALSSNVTIVSNTTSATGIIQSANAAITTYMEASW